MRELKADALVIGGGAAGTYAALCLQRHGVAPLVISKGLVGKSGASIFAGNLVISGRVLGNTADNARDTAEFLVKYHNQFLIDQEYAKRCGQWIAEVYYPELEEAGLYLRRDDAGNVVTWQAQVGQPQGSMFSPDTAIRDAQLAWNNDPDSRINYAYNMTRIASDPGNDSSNGINAVLWDDPGNDIPGAFDPVNCTTGVLGVGGQFFNATTRVFDGNAYHQAVEGFLIIQDGGLYYHTRAMGFEFADHQAQGDAR